MFVTIHNNHFVTLKQDSNTHHFSRLKQIMKLEFLEFSKMEFRHFNELKSAYGNASIVGNNRVIFNIKGNDFRLVVSVNFHKRAAYIIWFGTHKEYDKIDTESVEFNIDILNYKTKQ